MKSLIHGWERCTPATKVSLFSAGFALFNLWLGVVACLVAAAMFTKKEPLSFEKYRDYLFFAPMLVGVLYLSEGVTLPPDDLWRHITAWRLDYDYRYQYPWSELPKANLWLGFDYALGQLQKAGVDKFFLLQWLPGLALILQTLVVYGAIRTQVSKRHHNAALFVLAGALAMMVLTPRALLARPEIFILIFGGAAIICKTRIQALIWCLSYMLVIPVYWLGWVYAPMALLLAPSILAFRARFTLAAILGLSHLFFWNWYTGDYVELMLWLKGTLSVPASENAPLLHIFKFWTAWVYVGVLVFSLSTLNKRRAVKAAPYFLLLLWFTLPNQVRYFNSIALLMLPWLYRTLTLVLRLYRTKLPAVPVLFFVAMAALTSVGTLKPQAMFALGAEAKVYSQSPYSTVFMGEKGIQVEPSFALGASKPEWKNLIEKGVADCPRLVKGGFTHVIEHTLTTPLECAALIGVQGEWRLWKINVDKALN